MTTTTTHPRADDFQADYETREANARRWTSSKHADECFLCGRGLTEKAIENGQWIHLTTGGLLVPKDYEGDDSQGCFPVGSECAKRIPKGYKFKIARAA